MTDTNWSLYYKFDGDRPQEFREVRRYGSTVWTATGKVCTWGEAGAAELGSASAARSRYEAACREAEADGFVLTRQGTYDPRRFDFAQLTEEVREGARRAFTAVREAHPDQTVNSFALVSDDSAMTIGLVANSKEGLAEAGDDEDCLWNCGEWSLYEGGEFLDIAYRMILPRQRDFPCEVPFAEFRDGVFESCVTALEQLDAEGFFGTGKDREEVVLLFQVTDSDEVAGAIERLNMPGVYQRYRAWYDSWH